MRNVGMANFLRRAAVTAPLRSARERALHPLLWCATLLRKLASQGPRTSSRSISARAHHLTSRAHPPGVHRRRGLAASCKTRCGGAHDAAARRRLAQRATHAAVSCSAHAPRRACAATAACSAAAARRRLRVPHRPASAAAMPCCRSAAAERGATRVFAASCAAASCAAASCAAVFAASCAAVGCSLGRRADHDGDGPLPVPVVRLRRACARTSAGASRQSVATAAARAPGAGAFCCGVRRRRTAGAGAAHSRCTGSE
jgi:hypothetical protein